MRSPGANGAFYNPTTQAGAALKASCFTLPLIPVGTMGVPNGDPFETNSPLASGNISASPGSAAPMLR